MKQFIHYDIPHLQQVNGPDGRVYVTPEGNKYPSVSTVLASVSNPELFEWRKRVGPEEANRISQKATKRGTKIHTWCECYLKQIGFGISPFDKDSEQMFFNLRPFLDKFQEIHALETRLWSDKLQVAGTVDCIAKIDNEMYVVDFKTSSRPKTRDEIHSYFHQTAAYALCFYERTGVVIDKVKILMTTEDNGVLEFDESVKPWLKEFIEIRRKM